MNFDLLRERMVEEQLIVREIKNARVLDAFYKVERHKFVPEEFRSSAYADYPLSIGKGQTISQPYMVALMTECLGLRGNEKVLEIGTGSGYQAAILAELAREVYTIERFESFAKGAQAVLEELGYRNIHFKVGDGTLGWPEKAPFDAIIITASAPRVSLPLPDQLIEGGRLILPIGKDFGQMLTLMEKKKGGFKTTEICGCVFVPLVGEYGYSE